MRVLPSRLSLRAHSTIHWVLILATLTEFPLAEPDARSPRGLAAQSPPAAHPPPEPRFALSYERPRFEYRRDGRRDPFLSLPALADVPEAADSSFPVRLLGIIHPSTDPARGVALLAGPDAIARPRGMEAAALRVGQELAGVRLVAVLADRVVIETTAPGPLRRRTIALPPPTRRRSPQ